MKFVKYTLFVVGIMLLQSCASTKRYRKVSAELIGYQVGYADLKFKYDSIKLSQVQPITPSQNGNQQLEQLQNLLAKREAALFEINQIVENAFIQYENQGIKVTRNNGQIYISMDNKLLFESGKAELSSNGIRAIKEVARLLEQQTNINVMIEGHTDNKGYIANPEDQIRDNWDLSCHRATAVTRTLLQNSEVNPKRITAAGRAQYVPINDQNTDQARALNRRTDIILIPQLDELWKIVDENIN